MSRISVILAWPPSVSLRILHADSSFNVFQLILNVIFIYIFFLIFFFFSEIAIVGAFSWLGLLICALAKRNYQLYTGCDSSLAILTRTLM